MQNIVLPTVVKTGQTALVEVTTKESSRHDALLNVRFHLPKNRLRVEDPHGDEAAEFRGGPVAQIPMVMN